MPQELAAQERGHLGRTRRKYYFLTCSLQCRAAPGFIAKSEVLQRHRQALIPLLQVLKSMSLFVLSVATCTFKIPLIVKKNSRIWIFFKWESLKNSQYEIRSKIHFTIVTTPLQSLTTDVWDEMNLSYNHRNIGIHGAQEWGGLRSKAWEKQKNSTVQSKIALVQADWHSCAASRAQLGLLPYFHRAKIDRRQNLSWKTSTVFPYPT